MRRNKKSFLQVVGLRSEPKPLFTLSCIKVEGVTDRVELTKLGTRTRSVGNPSVVLTNRVRGGVKGEALPAHREPLTTHEMWCDRLFLRANNLADFSHTYEIAGCQLENFPENVR
ncbi:hypothetical protein ACFL0M_00195 [Thermodesulfobacteriota bacterium]